MNLQAAVERTWTERSPFARALRTVLAPAAAAYGGAITMRNQLYDRGWLSSTRVPAGVVAVGNLTVGGTGKTPTALWLATALGRHGHRVAIVTRGYRKRTRGVVVIGTAGRPLVGAAMGGDEAVMLARRFGGPVIAGERRVDAAHTAIARFGVDTLVLDDGFQHRALARDVDLVLVSDDLQGARLLPAGALREPLQALRRAHAVLAVGRDGVLPAHPPLPVGLPRFRGRLVAECLVRVIDGSWVEEPLASIAGRSVTTVTGIARPQGLLRLLEGVGVRVVRQMAFRDHHEYTPHDLAAILEAAGTGAVITTEKDLVKLEPHALGLPGLRALRVSLEVEDEETVLEHVRAALPRLEMDAD